MAEKNVKYPNLEILRKANSMTVDSLMEQFGYSRDTYYRTWQNTETGNIKSSDLIKLHKIFDVSVDCILGLKPLTITG